jgi:hypothetical protein
VPLSALKSAPDSESTDPPTCLRSTEAPSKSEPALDGRSPDSSTRPGARRGGLARQLARAQASTGQSGSAAARAAGTSALGDRHIGRGKLASRLESGLGLQRRAQARTGPSDGPARRAGGLLKTAEYLKEATPLRLPVRAHTESSTEPVRHFRCPCKTASRACQPKRLPAPTCGECGVGFLSHNFELGDMHSTFCIRQRVVYRATLCGYGAYLSLTRGSSRFKS